MMHCHQVQTQILGTVLRTVQFLLSTYFYLTSLFENSASTMTIITRRMQKAAKLTSDIEVPTMPDNVPTLEVGSYQEKHPIIATKLATEPPINHNNPLALAPAPASDNPVLELTGSTKSQSRKGKGSKAKKPNTSEEPIDVATQAIVPSLEDQDPKPKPKTMSAALSQSHTPQTSYVENMGGDPHRGQSTSPTILILPESEDDGLIIASISSDEEKSSLQIINEGIRDSIRPISDSIEEDLTEGTYCLGWYTCAIDGSVYI